VCRWITDGLALDDTGGEHGFLVGEMVHHLPHPFLAVFLHHLMSQLPSTVPQFPSPHEGRHADVARVPAAQVHIMHTYSYNMKIIYKKIKLTF